MEGSGGVAFLRCGVVVLWCVVVIRCTPLLFSSVIQLPAPAQPLLALPVAEANLRPVAIRGEAEFNSGLKSIYQAFHRRLLLIIVSVARRTTTVPKRRSILFFVDLHDLGNIWGPPGADVTPACPPVLPSGPPPRKSSQSTTSHTMTNKPTARNTCSSG